jgi:hypothetical protein
LGSTIKLPDTFGLYMFAQKSWKMVFLASHKQYGKQ